MAQMRTDVAMIKQIHQLYFVQHLSKRAIARSLGVTPRTVRKAINLKNSHQDSDDLKIPSPVTGPPHEVGHWSQSLDWQKIHSEYLQGATLKILHQELAPAGVSYWVFNREYKTQKPATNLVTMRLIHNPGEKSFYDFADGIEIVNRNTGEITKTQLLVGVLPCSSKTWAEFVPNQKQANLMQAMERSFHFFGGVTSYVIVDNMKPAVTKAHLYDPIVNPTFVDFANHWNFAVIPTRPRKPRDKAAVEGNIGIIQRGFFQEVRNQTFYSLMELNNALREYLNRLNASVMKEYGITRNERFEKEKHLLKPLATQSFEISEWRQSKVHPDCHIQVEKCCYSVPYTYVGLVVRVKMSSRLVEIFDSKDQTLLTTHARIEGKFGVSTNEAHYPEHKVSITRFEIKFAKDKAAAIGPHTQKLVDTLFDSVYPLRFLRRVQGILRLLDKKKVTAEALEEASKNAIFFKKLTLSYIQSSALHFQHHGKRLSLVTPIRDESELYLHSNNNKDNNDNGLKIFGGPT